MTSIVPVAVSGSSASALQRRLVEIREEAARSPRQDLVAFARSITLHESNEAWRKHYVVSSWDTLARALDDVESLADAAVNVTSPSRLVFLLPGLTGRSSPKELLLGAGDTARTTYAQIVAEADRIIQRYESNGTHVGATAPARSQLFAVELAVATQLRAWGIHPDACLGQCLGEYVAAVVCGSLHVDDALELIVEGGRLVDTLPPGAMLVVAAPEEYVASILTSGAFVAVVNGRQNCVVSGSPPAVAAVEQRCADADVVTFPVGIGVAGHSPWCDPIVPQLAEQACRCAMATPKIPFLSNVTGTWITATDCGDPGYWVKHVRQTARVEPCVAEILRLDPPPTMTEVGPGGGLTSLIAHADPTALPVVPTLPRPQFPEESLAGMLNAVGTVWARGHAPNWAAIFHSLDAMFASAPALESSEVIRR